MTSLLVIDDDPLVLKRFERDFEDVDIDVLTAPSAEEGLQAVTRQRPDVVVLDVMLPGLPGLEAFEKIRDIDTRIPVIFITAGAGSSTAIEAMRLGAFDYLLKPLQRDEVRELVRRACEIRRLAEVPVELSRSDQPTQGKHDVLVGRCAGMQEVYKEIGRVASQDVTVLIRGESGTGKELVARAIYQHSGRKSAPFLAVNCAAIPESLLESELFGHEKGAFTGADSRRIGKFEQCSGGTLFLDEIGDMSPSTQSKVLRILQEQQFERLGGGETIQTDTRIITATNRDLESLVADGRFRSDLYYRLNVFTIKLPPLRERNEDLPLLLEHFLGRFTVDFGKDVQGVSPEALDMLLQYPWPGNVRELQNVLKQAILHTSGPVLRLEFLPSSVRESRSASGPAGESEAERVADWSRFIQEQLDAGSENLYDEALAVVERYLLTSVLRHTGGNRLQAAKILGMTRGTLRNKIKSLGISIEQVVDGDEQAPASPPGGTAAVRIG